MTTIQELNASVRATEDWIDDLRHRLRWHDRERSYLALLTTLHALRDCLPRDEAVYIGAHLPALLRGLYYEGWQHASARSRGAFLERIHDGVHRDPAVDAEQVARAVFALLARSRGRQGCHAKTAAQPLAQLNAVLGS
jgi:uncharacterized protein (DUF2267 family)